MTSVIWALAVSSILLGISTIIFVILWKKTQRAYKHLSEQESTLNNFRPNHAINVEQISFDQVDKKEIISENQNA